MVIMRVKIMDSLVDPQDINDRMVGGNPLMTNRLERMKKIFGYTDNKIMYDLPSDGTYVGIITKMQNRRTRISDESGSNWVKPGLPKYLIGCAIKIIMKNKRVKSWELPDSINNSRLKCMHNVLFISDTHVGAADFHGSKFDKLVNWLENDKQGRTIEYIIHAGDLINKHDAPSDDAVLKFLNLIPNNMKMILVPGNHDQFNTLLPISPSKNRMPENIIAASNPAEVIFENGFRIGITHGEGLDALNMFDITTQLKTRLQSRLYCADPWDLGNAEFDSMIMDNELNILHTGHTHQACNGEYNNTKLISTGSWIYDKGAENNLGWSKPGNAVALFKNCEPRQIWF